MVTFFDFPKGHHPHLRTSNVVESPFAAVRLRTNAAKRSKKVTSATSIIWKILMLQEKKFRRLKCFSKLRTVYNNAEFRRPKNDSINPKRAA